LLQQCVSIVLTINTGDPVKKTSALRIRIDPNLHHQFLEICKKQDRPASQVIRDFMRQYVQMHGGGVQLELFKVSESFKIVTNVVRKMD
jgi:antitoxin component of RelBE/YafQ-DinJ toxin-antitoxin module